MDLSIKFFFLILKIDTQIHTQKLNLFFFILNYLIRNFARDLQNTQTQTQNSITQKIKNPNPNLNL
jgi:hypothetical protein